MQGSRISQLIQMGSIGISDTTPVDSPCHPEGALSAQSRAALIERRAGSARNVSPPRIFAGRGSREVPLGEARDLTLRRYGKSFTDEPWSSSIYRNQPQLI